MTTGATQTTHTSMVAEGARRLFARRALAYLLDCVGYALIAAVEVPLGLVAMRSAWGHDALYLAVVSSVPPVLAAVLASRAEAGPAQATWGKRARRLVVTAGGGRARLARALGRNLVKITLPWTLGHVLVYAGTGGTLDGAHPVPMAAMVLLYALLGVDVALALVGSGRTLHDRVAGTTVEARPSVGES